MLYDIRSISNPSRSSRNARAYRVDPAAARLNPWLRWRPEHPRRPTILSVADLAECNCPDICDRDHGND
jgi:hypothetical protein